ncbi:hypothetical protein NDU88_010774 [Pleurodeles waltl]|uniref:Uncharacterized protein n=1 Tax=Pleurodeles waltl TaxID=8319 RepID=A0AAV7PX17_PLEWA|nr:hypothetical protein NDU88_010774 [Pleurodeles waltl]
MGRGVQHSQPYMPAAAECRASNEHSGQKEKLRSPITALSLRSVQEGEGSHGHLTQLPSGHLVHSIGTLHKAEEKGIEAIVDKQRRKVESPTQIARVFKEFRCTGMPTF